MDKQAIRAEMRLRRKALSAEARSQASGTVCAEIISRLSSTPPDKVVAVYLASSEEISLDGFIGQALRDRRRLVAPRWNGRSYELSRLRGLDAECVRIGPMGIREPAEEDVVSPRDVAVWFVPGLAFTEDGRRIGYGGGWYDRLLVSASANAIKTGVAYSFQVLAALPIEGHDMQLTDVLRFDFAGSGESVV